MNARTGNESDGIPASQEPATARILIDVIERGS
jgi:hypothetical protein